MPLDAPVTRASIFAMFIPQDNNFNSFDTYQMRLYFEWDVQAEFLPCEKLESDRIPNGSSKLLLIEESPSKMRET